MPIENCDNKMNEITNDDSESVDEQELLRKPVRKKGASAK